METERNMDQERVKIGQNGGLSVIDKENFSGIKDKELIYNFFFIKFKI